MDQYKRTDGNPSLRRSVSTKVEGTNEIAQLKSEIILLKRQNERLLKKEKRIQVKKNEGICLNTKKEHQINRQQKFYSPPERYRRFDVSCKGASSKISVSFR